MSSTGEHVVDAPCNVKVEANEDDSKCGSNEGEIEIFTTKLPSSVLFSKFEFTKGIFVYRSF